VPDQATGELAGGGGGGGGLGADDAAGAADACGGGAEVSVPFEHATPKATKQTTKTAGERFTSRRGAA
jgi:hypothetical protein